MECNKDEAVRAMEIAERKFTERDYTGAKKFVLKAQNLYPELEGVSQMLMTFDVYASAEKRTINGVVDWYSVLGLNPGSDEETVRRQYRKLALVLHPDKNKSLGADGAFNLVSEAWSLLSNKANKLAYDEKLNVMGSLQKVSTHTKVSSTQPAAGNGFYHGSNEVNSDTRVQNNNIRTGSVQSPSFHKPDTFWTICNRCKTQYEYLRMYLNHTLVCPNCHDAFLAVEKAPPPNLMKSSNNSIRQKHQNSRNRAANNSYNVGRNFGVTQSTGLEGFGVNSNGPEVHWNHFSRMAAAGGSVESPSTATGVQQVHQRVKREHEVQKTADGCRTGNSGLGVDHLFKRRKTDDTCGANAVNGRRVLVSAHEQRGNFETDRVYGFSGNLNKSDIKRELSPLELRNLLMDKARSDISRKLQEWSLEEVKLKEKGTTKRIMRNDANGQEKHDSSGVTNGPNKNRNSSPGIKNPPMINVPDSDFHNFDLDRTESSFREDQVWAAYDDDDGMPRYYARIQKVISKKPFRMKISWLNSRSSREFSSLDWVGSGFLKTCGDFRAGRYESSQRLNSFSHKVKWAKGVRGLIRILPTKGDVWAIYRNWSEEWNQNTPNEVIHQYDMVEVLDDYDEERGVSVAPLTKAAGFKTVFQRCMVNNEVRRIPKEEMFRFSHQVPYHLLTGEEARDAPKGCWELDPAATPLELLQVNPEANEAKTLEAASEKTIETALNCTDVYIDQTMEQTPKPEDETVESVKQLNDDR